MHAKRPNRIGILLSIIFPVFTFISFLSLAQDLSAQAQIAIITAVSAAISCITNIIGYFATGFFPDSSSTATDNKQDAIAALKERYFSLSISLPPFPSFSSRQSEMHNVFNRYEGMAYRLIELYMDEDTRKLAKKIVNDIDLDLLRAQMHGGVKRDPEVTDNIIGMLVHAIMFIKDKFHYPYNYPLIVHILSLQNYYSIQVTSLVPLLHFLLPFYYKAFFLCLTESETFLRISRSFRRRVTSWRMKGRT